MSLMRLFHTLRYLSPQQISGQIRRRLFGYRYRSSFPDAVYSPPKHRVSFPKTRITRVSEGRGLGRFTFIGKPRTQSSWDTDEELLWMFNLHYFAYLNQPDMTEGNGLKLMYSWISEFGRGDRYADIVWHPYVTSLRLVNWLIFMLRHDVREADLVEMLFRHVVVVSDNLEYDIDGNHLLTNLLAVVFGLSAFSGSCAERLRHEMHRKLRTALDNQINQDGGHCERSLLYHSIILELLIHIHNIGCDSYIDYITRMTDFLHIFTAGGNDIPLFNDAAHGVAPHPDTVKNYAADCCDISPKSLSSSVAILPETNMAVIHAGNWTVHIDGGGHFSRQPGHAHASALSFELWYRGEKIITDSGCCTYREGNMRRYCRSTTAHNTLTIDAHDQDELWGAFRMGRRARHSVLESTDSGVSGKVTTWRGAEHRRQITVSAEKGVTVTDTLRFPGKHRAELRFLMLNPSVRIIPDRLLTEKTDTTSYFRFFNTKEDVRRLRFIREFTNSLSMTTTIAMK